jgi:hypothetical protein
MNSTKSRFFVIIRKREEFMMKKIYVYIILNLFLVSFNGCNSSKSGEKESDITNSNTKNETIKIHTTKEDEEKKVLNKIGITTTNDGKIIIEPKKTKEFLDKIAKTMKKEAKRIKEENKNLSAEDIGISAKKDKIVIDINKTGKFLDKLSKDLSETANELEKIFK